MLKKVVKLVLGGAMMVAFFGTTFSAVNATSANARAIPESQTTYELIGGDLQRDATCTSHVNNYISYITLGGWSITPNDCYANSKNARVANSMSVYFTGSFYKGSSKGNLSAYHYY